MRELGLAVAISIVIGIVGYTVVGVTDDDAADNIVTRPTTSVSGPAVAAPTDSSDSSDADDDQDADAPVAVSAEAGQAIATATGCLACHTTDGSVTVGPSWGGLFGSTEEIEGGESVVVDAAYLRDSIVNPGARIVAGFGNLMPAIYGDSLSDAEIDSIVEYITSLQ